MSGLSGARPHPYLRVHALQPLPCSLLLDLHVHKNGGSTMRELYWENERRDSWLYWGYTLDAMRHVAVALLRSWNVTATSADQNHTGAPQQRLAAELHMSYHGTQQLLHWFGPSSAIARVARPGALRGAALVDYARDGPGVSRRRR